MKNQRRRAYRLGVRSEILAAIYLMCHGYRILARRYRTPLGEIDLIAKRGGIIAFVEVKARTSIAEAMDSLTATTLGRITAASDIWCSRFPDSVQFTLRYDAILMIPWRLPRHLVNVC